MKRTSFQHRRWYVIDASPAQFGGLVEALNALFDTDHTLWVMYGVHGGERPFHVYGLPLPETAPVVTVRCPGDGDIDQRRRSSSYAWFDAIAQPHGKTKLVLTFNNSLGHYDPDLKRYLWESLFDWLAKSGCPAHPVSEDEEAAPAVIDGGESTPPAAAVDGQRRKPGRTAPSMDEQMEIWSGWEKAQARGIPQHVYCDLKRISPSTLRNYRRNLEAAGKLKNSGECC